MRGWRLALLAAGILALATYPSPEGRAQRAPAVYPMVFPVAGEHRFSRDFGDPRGGGRSHAGIDIVADKLTPVVAVADGTVRWMHAERGGNCCAVSIVHDDGWRSRYIHLNNDTPGTDDGRGYGIARGLRVGSKVRAGQVIGYVGDSGNAEETVSHLHFELRRPDGQPADAYASLAAATADPATGPRIAGPPIGPPKSVAPARPRPADDVLAGRRADRRAAAERPDEGAPRDPLADGEEIAPDEVATEQADAEPVTPFLPTPGDSCSAGLDREIELAEIAEPERPTFACFRPRSRAE